MLIHVYSIKVRSLFFIAIFVVGKTRVAIFVRRLGGAIVCFYGYIKSDTILNTHFVFYTLPRAEVSKICKMKFIERPHSRRRIKFSRGSARFRRIEISSPISKYKIQIFAFSLLKIYYDIREICIGYSFLYNCHSVYRLNGKVRSGELCASLNCVLFNKRLYTYVETYVSCLFRKRSNVLKVHWVYIADISH